MPDLRRELMDVVYSVSHKISRDLEKEGYQAEKVEEITERELVNVAIDSIKELEKVGIIKTVVINELKEIYDVEGVS